MGLNNPIPANVSFTKRAVKDLTSIEKKDKVRFKRVWEDIKRFGYGKLPQPPKKLKGFQEAIWQIDSGAFRIFISYVQESIVIRGVLPKPDQKKRFQGMK